MEVTLKALDGAAEEEEYRFHEFPITIGRKLDNHICVTDPAVSRYHCQIVRLGSTLRVVDLGSQNGIRLNGRPVQQESLAHGDILAVGDVQFRIETEAEQAPPTPVRGEPTKADSAVAGMDTTSLHPSESSYLRPTPLRGAGRPERDLWTLLGLCRAVSERTSPEEAQIQLIERLFEAIPAERGAIVLCEEPGAPPSSVIMRSQSQGADQFEISRGVLQQVLREGRAFLRVRIQDDRDDAPRTMVLDQVQAALATPLVIGGRIIGVLYLDTRHPDALLDRGHLDLATAAASTTAATIESLRRQDLLRARAELLGAQNAEDADLLLLGESAEAEQLEREAAARARDDKPVLLLGPAGGEAERLARWIHQRSSRRDGPFIRVRCDTDKPGTLQRELFGGDRAGPGMRRPPLFEAAFGGTVALQGIASILEECGPQLLHLLRSGTLSRRGGAEEIPVNVRVMLLWEGDCDRATVEARLGPDLTEMAGAPLRVPALDERAADIPAIAQRLAETVADKRGGTGSGISPEVGTVLKRLAWPLNITQLRGVIERADAARTTASIEIDDLPEEILESRLAKIGGYHERVYQERRRILLDALERTNGNFSEAAELLEINRTYLHRLIRTLDLKDEVSKRFD